MTSAVVVAAAGAALVACTPSLPTTVDAYVVAAVDGTPTRGEGPAVDAYRKVFGRNAVVYAVGPEDAESGLPAAVVAVVALDSETTESDVFARALGPGDQVADREIEGVKVRTATSRQGDITLQVRIWRPAREIAVVVIGTRASDEADSVLAAVVRGVGSGETSASASATGSAGHAGA